MKEKRKRIIVKPSFQWRMVAQVILFLCVALLLVAFGMFMAVKEPLGVSVYERILKVSNLSQVVMPRVVVVVFSIAFIAMAVLLFYFLRYSHKIAGPLHRLGKYMEEVGKGNFELSIQFRRGDELKELADQFNRMLEGLRFQREQILKVKKELGNLLQELPPEHRKKLEKIVSQLP